MTNTVPTTAPSHSGTNGPPPHFINPTKREERQDVNLVTTIQDLLEAVLPHHYTSELVTNILCEIRVIGPTALEG